MPGLIRGVARTAAIAGTATAVSNRVSRRQAAKWAQEDARDAPAQQQYPPQQPQYQQPQYEQPQYQQPQYQQPAAAPAPATAPAMDVTIEQLKQLGQLHEQGILTDAEFAAQKAKLLGS